MGGYQGGISKTSASLPLRSENWVGQHLVKFPFCFPFRLLHWGSPDQPEESFGPEVSRRVSERVSPKMGVSEGVSQECLRGPLGPALRSVKKVSRECPWSVRTPF